MQVCLSLNEVQGQRASCIVPLEIWALFRSEKNLNFDTVGLSFLFDKNYLIIE
jgi:hypothetical protein